MGSYLDKPETTTKPENCENDFMNCGSSAMQGWRINQEDAHNSLLEFDDKTALFAVFDGHGGSEIAEYCSIKFPEFLKQLESYKKGEFEQALRDAFIGFDATLLEEKVIEELRQLARKNPDYEDSEMDEEDENAHDEIKNLYQEATMPLTEVLEKYKNNPEALARIQDIQKIIKAKQGDGETPGPSSSKSGSNAGSGGSGSSSTSVGPSSSTTSASSSKKSSADNEVSSSSSKSDKDVEGPSSSSGATSTPIEQPDTTNIPSVTSEQSTTSEPTAVSTNGTVPESVTEKVKTPQKTAGDDAISSSSAQENGETANDNCSSSTVPVTSANSSSTTPTVTSQKTPNHISSSELPDTESELSSDDENDETFKLTESPNKKQKPHNSDDDTTDSEVGGGSAEEEDLSNEDLDEEENSNDDVSEEEDEGLDEFMNNMETGPGKASGCTAVVALLVARELYVANAGDSRCVVCRSGKAVEMSFDHKPEDDIEFQRIRKAGGRVTLDGRVNGGLNLSRALGDHGYKMNKDLPAEEQMISALPDLKRLTLEPNDEFMVLACDGIWNYMSNEEVVGFVKQRIDAGKLKLAEICEELFQNCLAPNTMGDGTGCDNMTAIIVKFKPSLLELPTPAVVESNVETQKVARKRSADGGEAAASEPNEKKQKIEDELPAAVDTSTA